MTTSASATSASANPAAAAANPAAVDAVAAALRDGMRSAADRGSLLNEASTLSLLIRPALAALGYPATHRVPEYGEARNRLDEACFLHTVTAAPGYAAVIVEAKQPGIDFDRTPASQGRYGSPDRQIQRYLKQHIASGPDTIGVLTDGIKWRIYRRSANPTAPDVEFVTEYNFQPLSQMEPAALPTLAPAIQEQLAALVERLARPNIAYRTVPGGPRPPAANPADALFAAIAASRQPEPILRALLNEPDAVVQSDLRAAVNLQGVRKDAHDSDWAGYAYASGVTIQSDKPDLAGNQAIIAAVQYKIDDAGRELSRSDAALCARAFASAGAANAAAVCVYAETADGALEARLAVSAGGQVNMTAAFDPTLPSPSARAAIAQLLPLLQTTGAGPGDGDSAGAGPGLTAERLLAPLEAASLRQQFYREVAQWTGRMQDGKDRPQRQAVLRHLVRVMFAWILKEENIIPPELFERAFAAAHLDDLAAYHRQVLAYLFHQRLNVQAEQRDEHPVVAIQSAMEQTPFLNGSLFAVHHDDEALDIAPADYWSADAETPGLFTILSRYHWTMDEHRPGESEQTLDPELLSNLFERLITPTEEGRAPPLRQPQGTYYTPADVADEMVKDALSAAVRDAAPPAVSDAQLLELFGAADAPLPSLTSDEQTRLAARIRELRIFDPAVGSGEFLFSALLALQRALGKLESSDDAAAAAGNNPADANPAVDHSIDDNPDDDITAAGIIRRQLAGQDIHPLAVQIARLRLFIAITAARVHQPGTAPGNEPLPNLEARIVCADTLATVADPQWRPDQPGRLDTADPELIAALTAVAENRAQWFDAHTEARKQELLTADQERRDRLAQLLSGMGDLATPELTKFAETPLYNPTPAQTDARLLFYENPWRGFDVVIGNPPYTDLGRDARKSLVDAKRYRTTNVGNTYSLFCETGLALTNPNGGVVTMIVPLSIAFGQRQKSLRDEFETRCKSIDLRHYDNRPDTAFNASPTVRSPENRQRATVFTAVLGNTDIIVRSGGLQRWPAAEREECLAHRAVIVLPKLPPSMDERVGGQWLRIPTKEIAELAEAIAAQERTVISYAATSDVDGADDGELIAFPQTAYQFIGVIPAGSVTPRRETAFRVKDKDTLRLLMAMLNGHVGYAWWWMVGDGFHVKPIADHGTLTVPNICSKNPQDAIDLGQRLIDAIPECIVETLNRGTVWRNVNFHRKPGLIEELDRLHLGALGLPAEPLLRHLRIMRSSSSWDYGGG